MDMREQWMLYVAARTNVGMLRDHNEDNLGVLKQQGLFVVADGMGGHAAGEVASQIAVETVLECFEGAGLDDSSAPDEEQEAALGLARTEILHGGDEVSDAGQGEREDAPFGDLEDGAAEDLPLEAARLASSIKLANLRIYEQGHQDKDHKGMGTTIVAMKVDDEGRAHLAHVGDSRIYLYRGGDLMHMTRDHSWFADLMANAHEFTPQTLAYAARYKNVITRALGMEASVEVDLGRVDLEEGDLFLLCSDGLHDMIEDDEIADILARAETLQERCDALIKAANDAGGDDNISVVLILATSSPVPGESLQDDTPTINIEEE